jgi:hypothetical protein
VDRRYMVWVDANGFTRLTLVNGDAPMTGVQTQLVALSNADVLNSTESALTVNPPFPPGAAYRTVGDAAVLTFTDGTDLVDITLPAPLSSIFLADQATVDITQIGAMIAAVVGTVRTSSGGLVTAYVAGLRRTRKGESY